MKAHALLGGGAFLPVHWGTFSLALHAWDEPAETLLALGAQGGARLVMPRLGEAVEPAHARAATPLWRGGDADAPRSAAARPEREPQPEAQPVTLPAEMRWPLD